MSDDFFYVDLPTYLRDLRGVPGVTLDGNQYKIHRTHVPLLSTALPVPRVTLDRLAWDTECAAKGFAMRPHQHDTRDFVRSRRGTLLADGLRTGKTLGVIAAHDPSTGPLVVVCPKIVRRVWQTWSGRVFPSAKIVCLSGITYRREDFEDADVIIMHYDVAYPWMSVGLRREIGTLALDEAHLLASRTSKRTQAANMLAGGAHRIVAMTGTPLWNKPAGLWPILNIVSKQGFGAFYDFAVRYCDGQQGTYGFEAKGYSNEFEFQKRLSEIMLRRTWSDISSSLPTVTRNVEIVDITRSESRKIDVAFENVRKADSPRLLISELAHYRKLLGEIKTDKAIEQAKRVLVEGLPVVVWTWHKSVAAAISVGLKTKFVITGETPEDLREALLDKWYKSNDALVITLGVGQAGIDLSHAQHCVFAEVDFTPAVVAQAEMRTFSPVRPMDVTYCVADHDVDKQLVEALASKCEMAYRLGTPTAEAALDVISAAFSDGMDRKPDMTRLLETALSDDTWTWEDDT